ncbi:unnamed protein product [Chondrus crispus]|uniref:Uncharacterized protein n=1 Tax=Chondrus crispus TaxID=2769 RepID=R7QHG0_CHOCR|nr:unnamed protein product [Chondrus crispus]CDF37957.1 unnamed protein product [Chondrus crispus]|eukprot:XP_005717826.1 unnamed protein product [Chondrus crispus]
MQASGDRILGFTIKSECTQMLGLRCVSFRAASKNTCESKV